MHRRMRSCVLRSLLLLILALAIGVGGSARAYAHGRDTGLLEMVICGEEGPRTVYLDAAGNPADPDRTCCSGPCLDCTLAGVVDLPVPAALPIPPDRTRMLAAASVPDQPIRRRAGPAMARGPPSREDLP